MTWIIECRTHEGLCGWARWFGFERAFLCDPTRERAYEFCSKPDAEIAAEKMAAQFQASDRNIKCTVVPVKS